MEHVRSNREICGWLWHLVCQQFYDTLISSMPEIKRTRNDYHLSQFDNKNLCPGVLALLCARDLVLN